MRKTDARKLDHKTLTAVRQRAVASVQEGHSPELVAKTTGIARATMYGWLARYRKWWLGRPGCSQAGRTTI